MENCLDADIYQTMLGQHQFDFDPTLLAAHPSMRKFHTTSFL
jgi:hypothetical protein